MDDSVFLPSAKEIARICGVSLKTARRWKKGTICPPRTALMILSGDLGYLSPEWRGWRIRGNEITSPYGWTISRGDALTVPLMHGQLSALRIDLANARARIEQLEGVENQPLPDSWVISVK